MTRRTFCAIAGASVAGGHLILEAIAAERMPHRISVSGIAWSPFFEWRNYGIASRQMIAILQRHGVCVAWQGRGKFLFPFDSLSVREQAWRRISADPEWIALAPNLTGISVYRASS